MGVPGIDKQSVTSIGPPVPRIGGGLKPPIRNEIRNMPFGHLLISKLATRTITLYNEKMIIGVDKIIGQMRHVTEADKQLIK